MRIIKFKLRHCTTGIIALLVCAVAAGEAAKKPAGPARWERMDYGPVLAMTIRVGGKENCALKGLVISLDEERHENVCFDTELLRITGAWSGGWHNGANPAFQGTHGQVPLAVGTIQYTTHMGPGWARDGSFTDPRTPTDGPLPAEWAKYKGLYINGRKVVLSYTVGDCSVLELDGMTKLDSDAAFTRTLNLSATSHPLKLLVCDLDNATGGPGPPQALKTAGQSSLVDGNIAILGNKDTHLAAGTVNAPKGAEWEIVGSRIILKIPALAAPAAFKVVIAKLSETGVSKFPRFLTGEPEKLEPLTHGGPARYPQTMTTTGTLGIGDEPYVVDTLTAPENNPWNAWMRFGGLDFFSDGKRAALSTWSGDVWIVSGIDGKLDKLAWKRFATGLFQPLGLKIVNDQIYALGRDQITRFYDYNGDGEADYYEDFNNDCIVTPNFHEFAFDLQTDSQGNFYFTKAAPVRNGGGGFERISAHNGCLLKVSKDGGKLEVFAAGFRAPNGISIGPRDEITSSDNEGTWTPESPINLIHKGGFYGVPDSAHREIKPTTRENPVCWIPYQRDNSAGGQVWVAGDKWGPFSGQLLHLSYGKCTLSLVMIEHLPGGEVQGGVSKFPLTFASGICRARFNSADGQLYVAGLRGWQTNGAKDGCFQRVRYTGKPVHMPCALKTSSRGIEITFTSTLDPAAATDLANYAAWWFNVKWTAAYGSDRYSPTDPLRKWKKGDAKTLGDDLPIKSAQLSPDGKTVTLEIPSLKPVTNIVTQIKLRAADGTKINCEIDSTINKLD